MEPHNAKSKKAPEYRTESKTRRFQIVRLEDRIAPRDFGHEHGHCGHDGCGGYTGGGH